MKRLIRPSQTPNPSIKRSIWVVLAVLGFGAVSAPSHAQMMDIRATEARAAEPVSAEAAVSVRPRLNMLLGSQADALPSAGGWPQGFTAAPEDESGRGFSWSLQAWQLNTASLAHIRCDRHVLTLDAFVAEDCRFVDQPVPEDVVNLVQIRGQWTAAPGLALGLSALLGDTTTHADQDWLPLSASGGRLQPALRLLGGDTIERHSGLGLDISFGIQNERLGDFLVGLQVARYQQRLSLADLQSGAAQWLADSDLAGLGRLDASSAELALGWRRGRLSGELIGRSREEALIIGGQRVPAALNSFDLEFSWNAPGNASFSVGISNLLDNAPRSDEALMDVIGEDAYEQSIYGRIPYVRYKHDL